jgi:transposase
VRGKAAGRLDGFGAYVRDPLRGAPALNVDETPARAAGGLAWVHVACTRYLTLLHTGDRSADSIDAGGVLPGYQGIIVRDGRSRPGCATAVGSCRERQFSEGVAEPT